ncbi:winged helix-turn-helix transcriptional regulator [Chitinophaga rhizosphaerae]|uniref:winged helix-turn-helix transcriptional regulator n=1 Tax=Chitinophaga rhizosphaerae TaxID=1864947 RepID=UPI000F80EC3A|nr:helix-turn-helix domain-containing protein [Chitinophaga rhizosphaerae]
MAAPLTKKKNPAPCPFQESMDLLSGKWTMSVINALMGGVLRFGELERAVPGINTRMLARTVKELEERKIVSRKPYPTVPPTVEYTLTEKGLALKPVIQALQAWAITNYHKVQSEQS